MTIESLKERAELELQRGVEQLRKTGDLAQTFWLFSTDGVSIVIAADPSITNSSSGKQELANRIRQEIAEKNLVAVMMVSDTFWGEMNADQAKIQRRLQLSVEQAAAMGLCTKYEAAIVTIDSPIYKATLRQVYERKGGRIVLRERRDFLAQAASDYSGRFMSFFPSEAATA